MFYIPEHREHYLYGPDAIDQFVSEIHHERTIAHGSEDLIRQGTFQIRTKMPQHLSLYPARLHSSPDRLAPARFSARLFQLEIPSSCSQLIQNQYYTMEIISGQ